MKTRFITLLITLCFTSLLFAQVPDSMKYKSVGPDDFLTLIRFEEKAVLVDVRLPFEFRKQRISGAVNIPVSKTGKRHTDLFDNQSVILLYCTTDVRSRRIALVYYDSGFRNIYNLTGGIEAWKRKGLETEGRKKE